MPDNFLRLVIWVFSVGPAATAENISIQEQRRVGCCSVNVIVNWKILHVCRVDVPNFIVWLTVGDKTVSNKVSNRLQYN